MRSHLTFLTFHNNSNNNLLYKIIYHFQFLVYLKVESHLYKQNYLGFPFFEGEIITFAGNKTHITYLSLLLVITF